MQGSGAASPVVNQTKTIEGRVVGDFQGSTGLSSFFVQDAGDGDAATSDGIFVFGNTPDVAVGDLVQVTGKVVEFNGLTEISPATSITACGIANPPTIAPISIDLPVASTNDFERYEGMLVTFPKQLFVTENFQLGRFGELTLSADGRRIQPTNIIDPNDDPATGATSSGTSNVAAVTAYQNANNLRSILLDDGSNVQNPATVPYLNAQNTRRSGDSVANLEGVLSYGFGVYRVEPTVAPAFVDSNPRPTSAPAVTGNIKVASFNVLNYFNDLDTIQEPSSGPDDPADNICGPLANQECRGADTAQEFERQRAKIVAAIRGLDADVVGLIEIANDGDGADSSIADLVRGLNTAAGSAVYTYTNDPVGYGPGSAAALYPGGDDAIKVAFIYKPGRVTPVGAPVASPDAAFGNARAPIAQTFKLNANGAIFTAVMNHFKSKSGTGTGADADQNDGQGNFNASRRVQAAALLGFIDSIKAASNDPDVLVLGDLNAYTQEDPIDVLRAGGLTNLIDDGAAYSYVFGAQSGSLDHALASASLLGQGANAAKWHINADEPLFLDYNTEFKTTGGGNGADLYAPTPYRSSDHDPVLVGLNLAAPNTAPLLSAIASYDTGLGANGAEIVDLRGDRAVLTNAGDGSIDILDTSDLFNITRIKRVSGIVGLNSAAIHPTKDFFLTVSGTSGNVGLVSAYRLSDGTLIAQAATGILPDSVDISPSGDYAVIANEAEGTAQGNNGGDGSLSVVDLRSFDPASATNLTVTQVALPSQNGVSGFSTGRTDDVGRLPVDNTPATLEPETVTFSPNSQYAYVSLQENNGVVRLALADNNLTFFGLGLTSHPADLTAGDGYNPNSTLTLFREPDGVAVTADGKYFVTADEGDTRDGNGNGAPRGGRTVSIFDATTGALVGDTGNQLDAIAAAFGVYPDARSNRGGSEPEVLDVATFGGKTIVAVGLERANAVAFIDITTPTAPLVFGLVPTGNAPEGTKLVVRDGSLFAFTANEASGTLSVVRVPVGAFTLSQRYTAGTPLALADLYVIDPNSADTIDVTIQLDGAAGVLSGAGLTSAGNGSYTLSGTPAAVNTVLAGLTFTPAAQQNGTFDATFTITDGKSAPISGKLTLVGIALNTAPTATLAAGLCLNGNLSVGSFFLTVGDAETSANKLTVTRSSSNTALVPTNAVSIIGNGATRIVTIIAKPNVSGRSTITLAVGDGMNTTTITFEVIVGSKQQDTLNGTDGPDVIFGLGGDDSISAGGGTNVVCGGGGKDTITSSDGNDLLLSGDGDDTINAGGGNDIVYGDDGNDMLLGGDGRDTLFGGAGNDTLTGGAAADFFDGGRGTDVATDFDAAEGDKRISIP